MSIRPNQNDGDTLNPNPHSKVNDPEHPGYEVTDVNVNGVVVFLGGLVGFVAIFFVVCFVLGRLVNNELNREDGAADKWHAPLGATASMGDKAAPKKRENLAPNPVLEQRQAQQIVQHFPGPRLDVDDGNQSTSDIHAKEDLLLGHYSTIGDMPGSVRIPIERAMELVAQRGLPVATSAKQAEAPMVGAAKPMVTAPLTNGFARTAYELDQIEARKQKVEELKEEKK